MATLTRRATVADARAMGALQLRAWWRNHQDVVDAQHLMEEDEDSRAAHWTGIVATGQAQIFVAEVAGAVHGFAAVGPSREPGAPAADGELYALFVDTPAQGAGLGTALVAEAEQALRAEGYAACVLRTFTGNGLARTFFERHGYVLEPGGETPHQWGVTEVRYRRAL